MVATLYLKTSTILRFQIFFMLWMKKSKQLDVRKNQKKVVMENLQNALLTTCGMNLTYILTHFLRIKNWVI